MPSYNPYHYLCYTSQPLPNPDSLDLLLFQATTLTASERRYNNNNNILRTEDFDLRAKAWIWP